MEGALALANLFDYLLWRGDLAFDRVPACEIDGMILARLSYLPLDGLVDGKISIARLGESALEQSVLTNQDEKLLRALCNSDRFSGVLLSDYVNLVDPVTQTQFAAVTAEISENMFFVAFRGTDNTLVGWKEDFNMSFTFPVPSQTEAVGYFERVAAARPRGSFLLGGHSKGGNLAACAAAFCSPELQDRILRVMSFDGPGFAREVLEREGYQRICGRISTFVPQSSVVGMLLEHEEKYTVIRSTQVGPWQHDLLSWEVLGGSFITLEHVTGSSVFVDRTLKLLVSEMSPQQREALVDTVYELLTATNARTLKELGGNLVQNIAVIRNSVKNLDEPTKKLFLECGRIFLSSAKRTALLSLREEWNRADPTERLNG
ncbi:MAG: DUF2974 domain-containing protein [Faecousia sp.]